MLFRGRCCGPFRGGFGCVRKRQERTKCFVTRTNTHHRSSHTIPTSHCFASGRSALRCAALGLNRRHNPPFSPPIFSSDTYGTCLACLYPHAVHTSSLPTYLSILYPHPPAHNIGIESKTNTPKWTWGDLSPRREGQFGPEAGETGIGLWPRFFLLIIHLTRRRPDWLHHGVSPPSPALALAPAVAGRIRIITAPARRPAAPALPRRQPRPAADPDPQPDPQPDPAVTASPCATRWEEAR